MGQIGISSSLSVGRRCKVQMMEVATWAEFEALIASKKLLIQYTEDEGGYDLFGPEGTVLLWHIRILKNSDDATDFENNHQETANQPLYVRSSASRPMRVSPSPQPDGTTEKWKGYLIDCGASDETKYIDVAFDHTIYLRGGTMYSQDVVSGDKFKAEVQVIANGYTAMTPMSDIYLLPNEKVMVISPECMEFTSAVRLRVTFTPAQTGTAKKIYFILNYYD